jgi:hypothetical protein
MNIRLMTVEPDRTAESGTLENAASCIQTRHVVQVVMSVAEAKWLCGSPKAADYEQRARAFRAQLRDALNDCPTAG